MEEARIPAPLILQFFLEAAVEIIWPHRRLAAARQLEPALKSTQKHF
jgi:hypothetical protein